MNGSIARGIRRLLRMRVFCAFLLCPLTYWFMAMVGTYRRPGIAQTLGVFVGLSLVAGSLLLLVQRIRTAPRAPWWQAILDHGDRLALLLVVNLMLLSVLPGVPFLALTPLGNVARQLGLPVVAHVSTQALFGLFAAGVILVVGLAVLGAGEALARRARWAARAFGIADRVLVAAILLYCGYGFTLAYNGSLDRSPAVDHRTRIVSASRVIAVWPIGYFQWTDLESWRTPGTTERVHVIWDVDRDDLWSARLVPGQPVRVTMHAGLFGIPWVERMMLDQDRDLERLVTALPSAAIPRKRLVETLLREQRWDDALVHARAYLQYYPNDNTFKVALASRLRAAGRHQDAASIQPRYGAQDGRS